ncbi:MAG: tyrosine-type recombinase/integrase [Steroidobacteraceae bacterium]
MRERRKRSSFKLQVVKNLDSDLAMIRTDFTEYLRARGYADATLEAYERWLSQAARWLHESGKDLSSIFRGEIWGFLTPHMRGRSVLTKRSYRKVLFHWLKFQGRFRGCARPAPWWPLVEAYVQYLRDDRGVGASAVEHGEREAQSFLSWRFHEQAPNWTEVRTKDIWSYAHQHVRGRTPRSANGYMGQLRGFLRYVHLCGQCAPELVAAVPRVATHGHGHRCITLSEHQRYKLLRAFDRSRPEGRRDYAMTLCMLDLGLRATEVVRLQLDGIDWVAGHMVVPKIKTDRGRELPVPQHVLAAVRQYARRDRPCTDATQLFVRHGRRSGRPLTRGIIKQALRGAYRQCGFPRSWNGTHRLRHTFATGLYGKRVEPKTVADLLGHRHLDTTNIYVHLGPTPLRPLAQPWPIRC